jgi:hypothetical protein
VATRTVSCSFSSRTRPERARAAGRVEVEHGDENETGSCSSLLVVGGHLPPARIRIYTIILLYHMNPAVDLWGKLDLA